MSSAPGAQVWRPSGKHLAVVVAAVVAVSAGLLLTLPEDKQKPLRPTTVSRPSQSTAASPGSGSAASPENSVDNIAGAVGETTATPGIPPSPAAGAVSRPAEGRFVYHRTVEWNGERTEEEQSWIVTHLDGDLIEEVSAKGREGNPDDESSGVTMRWAPSGVTRTAMQFPGGEFPGAEDRPPRRCNLEPPLLTLPLPLEVGLTWESASACGEGERRTTEETSGRVARTERISVAGHEFDTFVIETSSGRGQRERFWFVNKSTSWFAPELGMRVRSTSVGTETELDMEFHREMTTELLAWPGGAAA